MIRLFQSLWRRARGLHPLLDVRGTSAEAKLASRIAGELERKLGLELKREVILRVRDPEGTRRSRTLGRAVGVVWEPRVGEQVVGLAEPDGRSCYVVRGPAGLDAPVVEHELAECIAEQHGLRAEGKAHTPSAWAPKVWGWV